MDEAIAGVGSVSVLIDLKKKGRESKPPEFCKCYLHTVRNETFGQCTLRTETERKGAKFISISALAAIFNPVL